MYKLSVANTGRLRPPKRSSRLGWRNRDERERPLYKYAITSANLDPRASDKLGPSSVKPNRSIPTSTVIPVLIYPDVRDAVAWLGVAFGFAERVRIGEHHRSQLSVGDGAVIIGDVRNERRPPRPGEVTHSVMVRVDEVDAHCERARSHGAQIVMEPKDFEFGERQYTAEDPAGHQWTFSQTVADVAPEEWGGISVAPD
jgi:uncharacterized glyoxalase superfamily protein PhnB